MMMWLKRVNKRSWLAFALVASAMFLQSCMNGDENSYEPWVKLEEDIVTIEEYLTANQINAQMDTATGVFYQIHQEGPGYKAYQNVEIDIHYQGETLDGVEYVNTFEGDPKSIIIGDETTYLSTMTNGLMIGLSLIQEGDSATIYVPSPWGYQDQGYQNVPANSILRYNIKLVDIKMLDEEYAQIDQYILDNNMDADIEPVYGIRYAIHRVGNNISPRNGAFISTEYQGELLDGTVFDSSYGENGWPLEFTYPSQTIIDGFQMGISQLHENDSATIFVPSIYGYKDQDRGVIPPNSILVFGLDIIRISNVN